MQISSDEQPVNRSMTRKKYLFFQINQGIPVGIKNLIKASTEGLDVQTIELLKVHSWEENNNYFFFQEQQSNQTAKMLNKKICNIAMPKFL